MSMLPEKHALPGAQQKATGFDWDRERGRRERGLQMGRHVVGSFLGMRIRGIVFGDEATEPGFEVAARRRIRVLLDQEARGSVLDEKGAEPLVDNAVR